MVDSLWKSWAPSVSWCAYVLHMVAVPNNFFLVVVSPWNHCSIYGVNKVEVTLAQRPTTCASQLLSRSFLVLFLLHSLNQFVVSSLSLPIILRPLSLFAHHFAFLQCEQNHSEILTLWSNAMLFWHPCIIHDAQTSMHRSELHCLLPLQCAYLVLLRHPLHFYFSHLPRSIWRTCPTHQSVQVTNHN